ncbi:MAG: dihydrofolate reductase [Candidatus Nanohaloarchaea archaeon]|nr:dihydrofolate reductase [Candidatus Nanohaloarchaea archaeon]
MDIVVIAAVARNGVIGKDRDIPWRYPEDWEHFKETTMGHPVIMGRVTYEGIVDGLGEPLPGRTNIVLGHEEMDVPDGVVNVHGIDAAVNAAADTGADTAYVAGGASVYEQFLERGLVDRMVITEIPEEPDGDTYFPDWDEDRWEDVRREELDDLVIVTYERR